MLHGPKGCAAVSVDKICSLPMVWLAVELSPGVDHVPFIPTFS